MKTYVIQDWLGLFHILQSERKPVEVYVDWLCSNEKLKKYAIDVDDLRATLLEMGVRDILFYSCREKGGHFKKSTT